LPAYRRAKTGSVGHTVFVVVKLKLALVPIFPAKAAYSAAAALKQTNLE